MTFWNSIIVCVFTLGIFPKVSEENMIAEFTSDIPFVCKGDINVKVIDKVVGSWQSSNGQNIELKRTRLSQMDLVSFEYIGWEGRFGIVPLNRDVLRMDNRVPCWIMWIPADANVTAEWELTVGHNGRLGWIECADNSFTIASTSLRTSEYAQYFNAEVPPFGPIRTKVSLEEFWKIIQTHENDILRDPRIRRVRFDRRSGGTPK